MKKVFILSLSLGLLLFNCSKENEPDNSNKINGHEYVDLGLPSGIKWATCNVGATTEYEYGNYYSWGITEPNTITWLDNNEVEEISGTSFDVAHVDWGGSWRMATLDEWNELINNCEWSWVSNGAKSGYNITGPNGNSIFLPAAGICQGEIWGTETQGFYWTSTRCPADFAYDAFGLTFDNNSIRIDGWNLSNGRTIRPVSN